MKSSTRTWSDVGFQIWEQNWCLFTYDVFNNASRWTGYTASDGSLINKLLIRKDVGRRIFIEFEVLSQYLSEEI
jgi:hypothetical protein